MIGRLNHVAIVVPDLGAASELYRQVLGARVSEPQALPEHGVTVIFVELPNTRIELLQPLGDASPVSGFSNAIPLAACTTSVTRSTTSSPRAIG